MRHDNKLSYELLPLLQTSIVLTEAMSAILSNWRKDNKKYTKGEQQLNYIWNFSWRYWENVFSFVWFPIVSLILLIKKIDARKKFPKLLPCTNELCR